MSRVSDAVTQFDKLTRRNIVFAGHGEWHSKYGTVVVPARTTINFYVRHGKPLGNTRGQKVDRMDFSSAGIVETKTAGDMIYNYVLLPKNINEEDDIVVIKVAGGQTFERAAGLTLGNHPKFEKNFVTVDSPIWLDDLFDVFKGCDLHWSACRCIEEPDFGIAAAWKLHKKP